MPSRDSWDLQNQSTQPSITSGFHGLVMMPVDSGLRIEEALGLHLAQVDFKNFLLTIPLE